MDLEQYRRGDRYALPYQVQEGDTLMSIAGKFGMQGVQDIVGSGSDNRPDATPGKTLYAYVNANDPNLQSYLSNTQSGAAARVVPKFTGGELAQIDKPTVTGNPAVDQLNQANFKRVASGQEPERVPGISGGMAPQPGSPAASFIAQPQPQGAPGATGAGPTPTGQQYTVQPGDTLSAIAARMGVPVSSLTGYRSGNPDLIYPGEVISVVGQGSAGGTTGGQGGFQTGNQDQTGQTTTGGTVGTTPSGTTLQQLLASAGVQNTSSLTDIVKELANLYGLGEAKNELTALDNQYADDVSKINDDPWIAEGIRVKRIEKLADKYDMKRKALMERLSLNDDIIGKAITLYNAEKNDQQQILLKAMDFELDQMKGESATNDIKEYNVAVQQGYKGSLLQWQTLQANLKKPAPTTINVNSSAASNAEDRLLASRNEGGEADGVYADPNLYASLRSQSPLGAAEFDRRFSYLVNPASKARLGIKDESGGLNFDNIAPIQ